MSTAAGARPVGALARLRVGDRAYRRALQAVALLVLGLLVAVAASLVVQAVPVFTHSGAGFITGSTWDPNNAVYGVLPFVVGTLLTSLIALAIAVPVGIGAAIFLAEYAPGRIRGPLSVLVELLAAVPSVVYGLWGLLVLAPIFASSVEPRLTWLPFAHGQPLGVGLLLASVVLAVMVLPTITAVTRDLAMAVPGPVREAVYGLGGTRWQVVRRAVLPSIRTGIVGAVVLALGRALGETMAVTFTIGNTNHIPGSLLAPAQTLASLVANEFTEATEPFHTAALFGVATILLLITVLVNAIARVLVWSVNREVREPAA